MGDNGEGGIAVFTADEMSRMLNAAEKDVLSYLALGAFAGIRTAEIVRLDGREINFESDYIEIKKGKARAKGRRLIKMLPNLVSWLQKVTKSSGPACPSCPTGKNAAEVVAANCVPAIHWKRNGLRHSFCTYRMAIVQNEHTVSAEMGNSPAMVFQNYRELSAQRLRNIQRCTIGTC